MDDYVLLYRDPTTRKKLYIENKVSPEKFIPNIVWKEMLNT